MQRKNLKIGIIVELMFFLTMVLFSITVSAVRTTFNGGDINGYFFRLEYTGGYSIQCNARGNRPVGITRFTDELGCSVDYSFNLGENYEHNNLRLSMTVFLDASPYTLNIYISGANHTYQGSLESFTHNPYLGWHSYSIDATLYRDGVAIASDRAVGHVYVFRKLVDNMNPISTSVDQEESQIDEEIIINPLSP
ncbi:MAG: hypothetical protein V1726_02015 [Methanobacteriota archaeon]